MDVKDSFMISYQKQDLSNKFLYQPGIFFIKPAIVTNKGVYVFELASWEKSKLMRLINAYKKFGVKVHWFKKKKIVNVQVLNVYPNLTDKQLKCLQTAIDNGYYDYPRNTDLKSLAVLLNLSYSTYHFHLRVAEKKIMPFFNEYIKQTK